jgi:hypothetical protein
VTERRGKLVGRKRLARAASDYIERKAIAQLKKQIEEAQKLDVLQAISLIKKIVLLSMES